eukprot:91560-Prorocentrum_minimum.AAC.4
MADHLLSPAEEKSRGAGGGRLSFGPAGGQSEGGERDPARPAANRRGANGIQRARRPIGGERTGSSAPGGQSEGVRPPEWTHERWCRRCDTAIIVVTAIVPQVLHYHHGGHSDGAAGVVTLSSRWSQRWCTQV